MKTSIIVLVVLCVTVMCIEAFPYSKYRRPMKPFRPFPGPMKPFRPFPGPMKPFRPFPVVPVPIYPGFAGPRRGGFGDGLTLLTSAALLGTGTVGGRALGGLGLLSLF